jgi:hypothetical protein
MLHYALYERMLGFARAVNPEIPAEGMIELWLDRMFKDDLRLHVLVHIDEQYRILEHAVIDVQAVGMTNVVVCHQVFREKPNLETFKYGLTYIDELVQQTQSAASAIYVRKHVKALERLGYKTAQILMIKCSSDGEVPEVAETAVLHALENGVQAVP